MKMKNLLSIILVFLLIFSGVNSFTIKALESESISNVNNKDSQENISSDIENENIEDTFSHPEKEKIESSRSKITRKTAKNSMIPTITKIISTKNAVTVYWKQVKGAEKYLIYRKIGNKKYTKIATLGKTKTKYTNTKLTTGKQYTYRIIAEKSGKQYQSNARSVTPINMKAPKLLTLRRYVSDKKECAQITWESQKGYSYYVLRKTGKGSYVRLKTVEANSKTFTYTDRTLKSNQNYCYSIRRVKKINDVLYKYSLYDTEGIQTISTKPQVKVDITNLHASISWKKVSGASSYIIFRKTGLEKSFKAITTVSGNKSSYKDVYYNSLKTNEEKALLDATNFVDPSDNGLVYTVRAYKNTKGKKSYGNYYVDGDFYLQTPSIVSVDKENDNKATIKWGTVKNAKEYYLYSGYKDSQGVLHWKRLAEVNHISEICMEKTVDVDENHTYFTVKAMSIKNGKTVYSSYDKGYTISYKKYDDKHVLFFGDSITFGSPYKSSQRRTIFSYPHRVQQLTGIQYYNPSIPGSTYTYSEKTNRSRMIQIADCLKEGRNVTPSDLTKKTNGGDMYVYETDFVNNQINGRTFKDFDVIVMAAGTNDYLDDAKLGDLDSEDRTEFNGALNTIMGYIKEASDERVNMGKKAIKVVFIDLFYSDRTYNYSKRTNRFVTKNKIGLTLTDYQEDLNNLIDKYRDEGIRVYQYANTTINEENCPYMTSDNLHMTKYAYTQIGNQLADWLRKNYILN